MRDGMEMKYAPDVKKSQAAIRINNALRSIEDDLKKYGANPVDLAPFFREAQILCLRYGLIEEKK